MRFLLRHWYNVSGVFAILLLIGACVFWGDMTALERLLYLNFIVIHIHVWEEFGCPGGFPNFVNTVMIKGSTRPDRYPLNQLSVMIGNWFFAFAFYLVPVFFPDIIWLGLMPMLFGILQVIVHGIVNNVMLKQWYNAGLAAALFGHLPLAIYYIYYIHANELVTWLDWVIAVVYMMFAYAVVFRKWIMGSLQDMNSPYPFTEEEMARFDKWTRFKLKK